MSAALDRFHAALSRVTSTGRYLPMVDGFRFVAIGGVLLRHLDPAEGSHLTGFLGELRRIGSHGWFGVQLFFAISGFVLALPFAEEALRGGKRVSLGAYYKRRVLRIEPPFLVAMCLIYGSMWLRGAEEAWQLWPNFLATIGYVHNQVYGELSPITSLTWSLEIEVQFYLLAPFLAQLLFARPVAVRRAAAVLAMVGVGVIVSLLDNPRRLELTLAGQFPYFAVGMLLADFYVSAGEDASGGGRSRVADAVCVAASAAILVCLAWQAPWPQRWKWTVMPPLVFVVYASAWRSVAVRAALTNRWICIVGGMCYTIYLYHPNLAEAAHAALRPLISSDTRLGRLVTLPLVLAAVFAGSAVLFVLVEKPCMRPDLISRIAARLRRASPIRRDGN
jgi:peptidoglycan/LPS O-acetylase OafA/YrhL